MADLTLKRDDYYQGIRPEMLKYIPSAVKKVLEIGCGEGNFGAFLKKTRTLKCGAWNISRSMRLLLKNNSIRFFVATSV